VMKKATAPYFKPMVLVRIQDANGIREVTTDATESIPVPGMVIKLNGIFSQTVTDMSNDFIMVHVATATTNEPTRWVPAAPRNQPISGMIGDIQSSSMNNLLSPTQSSFAYAPSLFTRVEGETTEGFEWVESGYTRRLVYPTFPMISRGDIWNLRGSELVSNLTSPSTLDFSIKLDGTFAISQRVTLVCPKIELLSASGCYSCEKGSIIAAKLRSTCGDGVALLESSDPEVLIYSSHIALSTADEEFTIYIHTPKKLNDFVLTAKGTGGFDSVRISFAAFPDLNINETKTYFSGTAVTGPDAGFTLGSFGDWLGSVFMFKSKNLTDYLLAAVIVGVIVLAVTALFLALVGSTILIVVMTWNWILKLPGGVIKLLTRTKKSE